MARYGMNFGAAPLSSIKHGFPGTTYTEKREYVRLVGVATTPEDRDAMVRTMTNGTRTVHVVEKRGLFGLYC